MHEKPHEVVTQAEHSHEPQDASARRSTQLVAHTIVAYVEAIAGAPGWRAPHVLGPRALGRRVHLVLLVLGEQHCSVIEARGAARAPLRIVERGQVAVVHDEQEAVVESVERLALESRADDGRRVDARRQLAALDGACLLHQRRDGSARVKRLEEAAHTIRSCIVCSVRCVRTKEDRHQQYGAQCCKSKHFFPFVLNSNVFKQLRMYKYETNYDMTFN